MKEEAPLIEKFSHYEIHGAVKIEAWGGGEGYIRMEPKKVYPDMCGYYLGEKIDLENHQNCIQFLNDSGFGCKQIVAAIVDVWKCYEKGGRVFWYGDNFNLQNSGEPVSEEDLDELNRCFIGGL